MKRAVDALKLRNILRDALCNKGNRRHYLSNFETLVGENKIVNAEQEQCVGLEDMAYDCAFYSADSKAIREDPAILGDEEIEKRIRETLNLFDD